MNRARPERVLIAAVKMAANANDRRRHPLPNGRDLLNHGYFPPKLKGAVRRSSASIRRLKASDTPGSDLGISAAMACRLSGLACSSR